MNIIARQEKKKEEEKNNAGKQENIRRLWERVGRKPQFDDYDQEILFPG